MTFKILLYMPDSVGFQEVTKSKNKKAISWYKLLTEGLKDYYNCNTTERNHIFYNKNKLDLVDQGTKWLSPTPDIPYTQFPKPSDGLTRTLSYAILKNKITGFCYMHINIHLDYKFKQNRIRQIKVVENFISKYKNNYPILLTGDFNSKKIKGEAVFYLLEHGYYDSADEALDCFRYWTYPAIGYQKNIYNNCLKRHMHNNGRLLEYQETCGPECDGEHGKIIDYCLRANDKVYFQKYKVVTDYQVCGGISSDHYPIYIEGYFV